MSTRVLEDVLDRRLAHAGLTVTADVRMRLVTYLELLARWNRKVNLTAFDLDEPTDHALDRLIVEPVQASSYGAGVSTAWDIGSGGGSPAIPFLVVCQNIKMTLVESRERKGAFLREVLRSLGLDARVAVSKFEDLAGSGPASLPELILMRAVKADDGVFGGVASILSPGGTMVWFATMDEINANLDRLKKYGLRVESRLGAFVTIRKGISS